MIIMYAANVSVFIVSKNYHLCLMFLLSQRPPLRLALHGHTLVTQNYYLGEIFLLCGGVEKAWRY